MRSNCTSWVCAPSPGGADKPAKGRSTLSLPPPTLSTRKTAHSANSPPKARPKQAHGPLSEPKGRVSPSNKATHNASNAQPKTHNHPGNNAVRLSIHQAVASNSTPKPYLMRFIHSPALGIQRLEVAPTTSSNTPEPQAKANNVNPPTTTSPVWEINNNTPANGAATQGPTMRADNIPITNTPPKRPAGKRFKRPCKRACSPAGACKVYTSNIDRASNAKSTAKLISTQGFCNHMAKLAPTKPATTPNRV